MSDFKPIETQEQLNEVIGERLKKAAEKAEEKYAGWTSPEGVEKIKADIQAEYDSKIKALEEAAAGVQTTLDEKDAKIAEGEKYRTDLEKTRIALAAGLKIEYAERLQGETAEEWKKDAQALAKDFAAANAVAPLGSAEPDITQEASAREAFATWMEQVNNQ